MTTFGELNTGDMFRYISNGVGAGAVYRKSSPRDAVQQRTDGTGDMTTVDATVKTRTITKVARVAADGPEIRFTSMGAGTDVDAADYGKPVLANLRGGHVEDVGYTTLVCDDSGEWQVVVTLTGRQDGKIAWVVVLVQVDDIVRIETGLSTYAATHDELNRAIARLTATAGWTVPLNQFTKG